MKDIIPAKKQSPILGLAGMGGGVGSNIVAGLAADPTYVDDVFSTYLYKGTGADQTINNGIKLGNNNAGNGVEFDGSGDYLTLASTSDVTFSTGDFTIEFWVKKPDTSQGGLFQISSTAGGFTNSNYQNTIAAAWAGSSWQMYGGGVDANSSGWGSLTVNAWYHIAVVRLSNTLKMYVNGTSVMSRSDTNDYGHTYLGINGYYSTSYTNKGQLSNFRVVKGTAVYTGNFTPPTAELTSITNTKLLCCNNSVMTTATVTPTDIAVYGDPHPSGGPFTATDGEGGMVWMKDRDSGMNYVLMDTERGIDKILHTDGTWSDTAAAANDQANTFRSFNNNGFTIGNTGYVSTSGNDYTSWTWRKQKGFFDIVKYTGTGSATTIPHNLGSVPGMIIIKRYGAPEGWRVYHRGMSSTPAASGLYLNTNDPLTSNSTYFNNTLPTSSVFSVGTDDTVNLLNNGYIAYLFAGGESAAADARSVDFDGTGDYLNTTSSSSDFTMGTGDYTVECWVKADDVTSQGIFDISTTSGGLNTATHLQLCVWVAANDTIKFSAAGSEQQPPITAKNGVWQHVALVRNSGITSLYVNGILSKSVADTFNHTGTYIAVGGYYNTDYLWDGQISNFRVVKGTAVYTSSFKPPTKPLENISGTVLLCCNDSSVTGSTVTPVTLNAQGNPQAITDSPFDDPDGFKFGEDSDENIIKCGSYTGNGDATNGTRVYLGFEPQWLLIKSTGFTEHWHCFDCMRGMVSGGGNDMRLEVNYATTEYTAADFIDVHPDGFTAYFNPNVNKNNENFVYVAVRRTDGLVGKPTESGTDVFTTTTGLNSSVLEYVSGFVTDFAIAKTPSGTGHWYTSARLIQRYFLKTNETDAQSLSGSGNTQFEFDSNVGWSTQAWGTNYQSWMWKRHAGLDVVTYTGVSGTQTRTHSLGVTPEMIWVKCRTGGSDQWCVGHKDLTGGWTSNHLRLNESSTESSSDQFAIAPTSTHWSTASGGLTNNNNGKYIAMLFASVDGISKVGSFAGSSSDVTLNLGFVPRFLMVKGRTGPSGTNWTVWDNIRGITGNYTSGGADTPRMYFNANSASSSGANDNVFAVNSGGVKGITIVTGPTWNNNQDYNYIYYAHA